MGFVALKGPENLKGPDFVAKNKDEVLEWIEDREGHVDNVFVIGGRSIYDLFMSNINGVYLTLVKGEYNCDTHINLQHLYDNFTIIDKEEYDTHTDITLIGLNC
jgi:dihydrofolate reductase